VIASSRGGSPELVVPGRTGWLFDPSEQGALERVILSAATELQSETASALSATCLEEARRFMPDRVVDSHLRAFESLVG
jgi:glycosyltransferase involved in cell wall biosynthesis